MPYPDLAALKTWLGVTGTSQDTNLTVSLHAAITLVERYCGRTFDVTTEIVEFPVMYPYVCDDRLTLRTFRDFSNVTVVWNGDGESLISTTYRLIPYDVPYDQIQLERDSGKRWVSLDNGYIRVNADWGVATPDDISYVVQEIAAMLYRRRQSGGVQRYTSANERGIVSESGAMPEMYRIILDKWRRYGA